MEIQTEALARIQADDLTPVRTDARLLAAHLARGRVRVETALALASSVARIQADAPDANELARIYEGAKAELRGSSEPWVDACGTLVRVLLASAQFIAPYDGQTARYGGEIRAVWLPTGAEFRSPFMPSILVGAALVRHAGSLASLARKAHPRALARDLVRALQDWCPELPAARHTEPTSRAGVRWFGDVAVMDAARPMPRSPRAERPPEWGARWKRTNDDP